MVHLPFCSRNMANDIGTKRKRCFINNRKLSYLFFVSSHIYQLVYVLACIWTSLLYSNACTSIVNTSFMAANEPHNQVSVSIMSRCAVSKLLNQFAMTSAYVTSVLSLLEMRIVVLYCRLPLCSNQDALYKSILEICRSM